MLSVVYADCHLCWVSHIILLCWVSLCWVPLCWVLLFWVLLCWVSLCWVSLCWMSLCWVSHFIYYYAVCRYAECRYAECRISASYADCRYAKCRAAVIASLALGLVILWLVWLIHLEASFSLCSVESAKSNGRGPKSCLARVFNYKLGCFINKAIQNYEDTWPHLESKARHRFHAASLPSSVFLL